MIDSFQRYLEAKKTVDDRALNRLVWDAFWAQLPRRQLDFLELGAGTGGMLDRLIRAERSLAGKYSALDIDPDSLAVLSGRLADWRRKAPDLDVIPLAGDLAVFLQSQAARPAWDVVLAHAVLDLFDLEETLPAVLGFLRPGGVFYFTINFDGLTALEPPVDPEFDEQVIALYHRSMDERRTAGGKPAGDSRTGRRLLPLLQRLGAEITAAGSSDWIVVARHGVYPADEAYFLRHILTFFETSLTGRPELDPGRLVRWLAARRAQIDQGELVFIAHQLDVTGRVTNTTDLN